MRQCGNINNIVINGFNAGYNVNTVRNFFKKLYAAVI